MSKKVPKLPLLLIALLVAFFLLRMGEIIPAGIIALIVAFAPLINRLVISKLNQEESPAHQKLRLSKKEALEILGLTGNPAISEIKAAHRRLIMKNHPDQGGSEYLATRINEAKRVLLEE